MSRTSSLIALGIVTILTPFSGLPVSVRSFLTALLGVCVLGIGFSLRRDEVQHSKKSLESVE